MCIEHNKSNLTLFFLLTANRSLSFFLCPFKINSLAQFLTTIFQLFQAITVRRPTRNNSFIEAEEEEKKGKRERN